MKTTIFALASIIPALACAADSGNSPYVVVNGRASSATQEQTSAATSPAAPSQTASPAQTSASQTRGVFGATTSAVRITRPAVNKNSKASSFGKKSHFSGKRRADGGSTTTQTEEAPPNFSKPGAWIRSEGQQPTYTKTNDATTHQIEGGSFIDIENSKALNVEPSKGLHTGPKDTLPTPNPGTTASGNTSITPNSSGSSGSSSNDNNSF